MRHMHISKGNCRSKNYRRVVHEGMTEVSGTYKGVSRVTARLPVAGTRASSGYCLTWPPGPSGGLSPCRPFRSASRTVIAISEEGACGCRHSTNIQALAIEFHWIGNVKDNHVSWQSTTGSFIHAGKWTKQLTFRRFLTTFFFSAEVSREAGRGRHWIW